MCGESGVESIMSGRGVHDSVESTGMDLGKQSEKGPSIVLHNPSTTLSMVWIRE
jgi:hypothetical protein